MGIFRRFKSDKLIQENKASSEKYLRDCASKSMEELLDSIKSDAQGLPKKEAEERLEKNGLNIIEVQNKSTTLTRLFESIINPFNLVLIAIAIISFLTDVVFAHQNDFSTVIIILTLVFISSAVAFVQTERSNKAAEELSKMISNKVDVYRDGQEIEIDITEVVVGDVIRLSAGDMIPADVRFLTTKDTFIAQAALTGESQPVEKFAQPKETFNDDTPLTDISTLGFMGANVISGAATAVAVSTANDTYFGSMATSLSGDKAKNSFERGVESVSKLLIKFMLVMVPIVLLINAFTKGDWIQSALFAISIAVGMTPEMLPVILTSTLAKGAASMSRRSVIVKTLGAIQTFGEIDVLCTDKTGTLTEDEIILEKYMNIHGEDDPRILRHAYLNSHFQTGLKNLLDLAVINRGKNYELENILTRYQRVDEIPFDFKRRRMSVVLVDETGKRQLITKGAVEEMVSICKYVEFEGKVQELDDRLKQEAIKTYEKHNNEGLRMIAVAQKNNVADVDSFGVKDESDMVLIGFVGFLDPPKESAKEAIDALFRHGVRVVVLTGDSPGVALKVCGKVGIDTSMCLTGPDVERATDEELNDLVDKCDIFAKLSPSQKERVVASLQGKGHTVGYLGDGINDALPLAQADVGISVDNAVDIAKETADIILLKKDLMVLEEGVIEGRKTFGNIIKYIKMAASGNFGNMFSVIIASLFLPFMPMLPLHILAQNLLCDFSQMGIPFDSLDAEYIEKPRRWDTQSIKRFMFIMGPFSSIFDVLCFLALWFIVKANTAEMAPIFQAGWFAFGTISQVLVIHIIRTSKIPFFKSHASIPLYISTILITLVTIAIVFSQIAGHLQFIPLPLMFAPWLALILLGYFILSHLVKILYIKKYGEWF